MKHEPFSVELIVSDRQASGNGDAGDRAHPPRGVTPDSNGMTHPDERMSVAAV